MAERRWLLRAETRITASRGPEVEGHVEVMAVADHLKAIEQVRKQAIAEVEEAPVELLRREAGRATLWEKRHESVWRLMAGEATDWPTLPALEIYETAADAAAESRERARILLGAAATLEGGTDA